MKSPSPFFFSSSSSASGNCIKFSQWGFLRVFFGLFSLNSIFFPWWFYISFFNERCIIIAGYKSSWEIYNQVTNNVFYFFHLLLVVQMLRLCVCVVSVALPLSMQAFLILHNRNNIWNSFLWIYKRRLPKFSIKIFQDKCW